MRWLLVFIFICCTRLVAQQQAEPEKFVPGFTTGYAYLNSNSHFLQLGVLFGKDYGNIHLPSKGFGAGVELSQVQGKFAAGTKAFLEYNGLLITAFRVNLIDYYSERKHDLRILPETGFTFFGKVSLTYGYGFPLMQTELLNIGRHRFALTINLIKSTHYTANNRREN